MTVKRIHKTHRITNYFDFVIIRYLGNKSFYLRIGRKRFLICCKNDKSNQQGDRRRSRPEQDTYYGLQSKTDRFQWYREILPAKPAISV